jgi:glutathione S-transferase
VGITLYSMGLSHPARSARLMLDHKGLDYKCVDIPTGMQPVVLRAVGFRNLTVPAMKINGRRVQGSLQISRTLDVWRPEPPLFPLDPERRRAVEEAEIWGESVYQPVPRRIFRWVVTRDTGLRRWTAVDAGIPLPAVTAQILRPMTHWFARRSATDEDRVRTDIRELPAHLDRVDALIADGTLDGEILNAADFQIATTTRTLLHLPPLRDLVAGRPAEQHAMRVAPDFGEEIPLVLPPGIEPAAAARAS